MGGRALRTNERSSNGTHGSKSGDVVAGDGLQPGRSRLQGRHRTLYVDGGQRWSAEHDGDVEAQLRAGRGELEAVLAEAGMRWRTWCYNVYAADVDAMLHYGVL